VAQGTTGADGSVTLTEARRSGFPASRHQRLLAVFVRASKPGDPALGGVSSRLVVAYRFGHHLALSGTPLNLRGAAPPL
jgi:hypothetical protein